MKIPETRSDPFVCANVYIDSTHRALREHAEILAYGQGDDEAVVRACFVWVRDEIKDASENACGPITCKASDVLRARAGLSFGKSHLLAALLRANAIPAGLCYQRLKSSTSNAYVLHGLVAVHILPWGWCRVDPLGDTAAPFPPALEVLARAGTAPGEFNFPEVWATPMPVVVETLHAHDTVAALKAHLPDIEPAAHAHAWGCAPTRRFHMARLHA